MQSVLCGTGLLAVVGLLARLALASQPAPLGFVTMNIYTFSHAPDARAEPHRPTLFIATGVFPNDTEDVVAENPMVLSEQMAEVRRQQQRSPPNRDALDVRLRALTERRDRVAAAQQDVPQDTTFVWEMEGRRYEGRTIRTTFKREGDVHVTLMEVVGGKVARIVQETVRCAYVRRELNRLTAQDRTKFFEAARTLYDTAQDEGRARYGPKFMNMNDLWAVHNLLGGDLDHTLAEDEVERASLLRAASDHSYHTESYQQQVEKDVVLEIDGEVHDWRNNAEEIARGALQSVPEGYKSTPLLGGEGTKLLGMSAPSDGEGSDRTRGSELVERSRGHNVLAAIGHGDGIRSNFATFALLFEDAIQSVDPSVTVPYWNQRDTDPQTRGQQAAHKIPTKVWKEKHRVTEEWLRAMNEGNNLLETSPKAERACVESHAADSVCVANDEDAPKAGDGLEDVEVETVGKWAYFPIITSDEKRRGRDGSDKAVYKGFKIPVLATEPLVDEDRL